MKAKRVLIYVLGVLTFTLPYDANTSQCSFDLPPNEQIMLSGNPISPRALSCKIEPNGQGNDYLLNFVSEANTSIVNNLMMPEGTIMSLSFASVCNDELQFELRPRSKLGVTNDSADFIRLICSEL